jgi:XFP C-terminal domain
VSRHSGGMAPFHHAWGPSFFERGRQPQFTGATGQSDGIMPNGSLDCPSIDNEEGTSTTTFDMAVLNWLDRFHLAMDVIEWMPEFGSNSISAIS